MHPALPDGDLAMVHGRAWRMIRLEWPAIRGDLDRGTLCPLGLVKAKSRDPRDLGANHQVLAWDYDLAGTRLTLRLYDPNHPDDDEVTLSLDTGRPSPAPTAARCGACSAPPTASRTLVRPWPPCAPEPAAVAGRSRPRRRYPGRVTSSAPSAPPRPGGLAAQPGYPAFLLAATLARLASEMFPVAAVLLVLDRTGRPQLAGAVVAATTLPAVVTGPVLGAWLDRTSRRRLALASNQVLLAASLLGILAAAGRAPGWALLPLAALAGLTGPLATGGYTSMIPVLVPERLLAAANALEATSFNTAAIAGPAVAGVVAATAGPGRAVLAEAALA